MPALSPVISVPVQSVGLLKDELVSYSIKAVVPVIFPSLPPSVVGFTPTNPVGAAGPSAFYMLMS